MFLKLLSLNNKTTQFFKVGIIFEQAFDKSDQKTHENVLNIIRQKENAN